MSEHASEYHWVILASGGCQRLLEKEESCMRAPGPCKKEGQVPECEEARLSCLTWF